MDKMSDNTTPYSIRQDIFKYEQVHISQKKKKEHMFFLSGQYKKIG